MSCLCAGQPDGGGAADRGAAARSALPVAATRPAIGRHRAGADRRPEHPRARPLAVEPRGHGRCDHPADRGRGAHDRHRSAVGRARGGRGAGGGARPPARGPGQPGGSGRCGSPTSSRFWPACSMTGPAMPSSPPRSAPRATSCCRSPSASARRPTPPCRSRPPPWRRPRSGSCMARTTPARPCPWPRPACSRRSPSSPTPRSASATPTARRRFEFPAAAYGGNPYPSFALEVARRQLGVDARRGSPRARPRRLAGRSPGADRRSDALRGQLPRARPFRHRELCPGPRRRGAGCRLRGQGGPDRRQRRRRRRQVRYAVQPAHARGRTPRHGHRRRPAPGLRGPPRRSPRWSISASWCWVGC